MNRKLLIFLVGFILFLAVLTGCRGTGNKTSHEKATPIPKPESGKTTVTGKIFSTTLNQPYPKAPVWLAEVFRQGDQGAFVVNVLASPSTFADSQGVFVIPNVDPKEYVIVVGDIEGSYVVIPNDTGRARVWQTEADKILDVGQLSVSLSPPTTPTP